MFAEGNNGELVVGKPSNDVVLAVSSVVRFDEAVDVVTAPAGGSVVDMADVIVGKVVFIGMPSLVVIPARLALFSETNCAPVAVIHGSG